MLLAKWISDFVTTVWGLFNHSNHTGLSLSFVSGQIRLTIASWLVSSQKISLGNRSTSYTLDVTNYEVTKLFFTITGSFTLTITGMAEGKEIYIRYKQGGSGGYTLTISPAPTYGATFSPNTAVNKVTTIAIVGASSTELDANWTKYA